MKQAFLDSSVLFTAVNSPTGGSAKLFTLPIQLVTSTFVLTEVERNVREKLLSHHLDRYFILVKQMKIVEGKSDTKLIEKAKKVIVEKDSLVLADAKLSHAEYLITLDLKYFFTPQAQKFLKPTLILTPKCSLKKFPDCFNDRFGFGVSQFRKQRQ